jgi:hypothetical protein
MVNILVTCMGRHRGGDQVLPSLSHTLMIKCSKVHERSCMASRGGSRNEGDCCDIIDLYICKQDSASEGSSCRMTHFLSAFTALAQISLTT